ncbi:unnamed protein product [Arabis nemorensis]|uniref:Uncharacterized protein n=1 Tax=Arabis nemorensis TaxID=586526 RepID=A0A565BTQ6_9BRAS|nr:unnamed protein product [Arabis nemorensis]
MVEIDHNEPSQHLDQEFKELKKKLLATNVIQTPQPAPPKQQQNQGQQQNKKWPFKFVRGEEKEEDIRSFCDPPMPTVAGKTNGKVQQWRGPHRPAPKTAGRKRTEVRRTNRPPISPKATCRRRRSRATPACFQKEDLHDHGRL